MASTAQKHTTLTIYSDGAARGNPGPAGAGALIKSAGGDVVAEVSEYLGETTNNIAEYKALILALGTALQYGPSRVEIRADSELVVKQLNGEYKVKNEGLKPLFEHTKRLLSQVKSYRIKHVYRSQNKRADELANEAIDRVMRPPVDVESGPAREPKPREATVEGLPEQGSLF